MEIVLIILLSWFAVDTKMELTDLQNQPPKIVKVIQIQEVEIPIPVDCPKPKDIVEPNLAIIELAEVDKENYSKVANAYVVSLNQCMSYAEQQEKILDSYR